jgi:hypothetical protein
MVKVSCARPKVEMEIAPTNSSKFIFLIIDLSDYGAKIYSQKKMFSNKCYIQDHKIKKTSQKEMFII